VYDGHAGDFSSSYLQDHLHVNLAHALEVNLRDSKVNLVDAARQALLESFRTTDNDLMAAEGEVGMLTRKS
jgi:hypothetical protein